MAAIAQSRPRIRAARPSEGRAIAGLWRQLWTAHEAWGGYPGIRDPRVYDHLALRLEDDARMRCGYPALGRHIHLVCDVDGALAGQVEGWFERQGTDDTTLYTCEIRSLIVDPRFRTQGLGRALLDGLTATAKELNQGSRVVMAAEVLDPNPAHGFYDRLGYLPVSWSTRVDTSPIDRTVLGASAARQAHPSDALGLAMLEATLASRRRQQGDARFDRPRAVEATRVGALAAHLAAGSSTPDQVELVATDGNGTVRSSASLAVATLDAPFVGTRRGVLSRLSVDQAVAPERVVAPLVRLARRFALLRGAPTMEITDLDAPQCALFQSTLAQGARPWSRIVQRVA